MNAEPNEPTNEGFDRQVGFIEIVWFVLAAVFVFLILAYWYSFSKYGWSTNPDAWGQFGDFLGGVLNPLVSLAALFALVISVRMQRTELKNTRSELIETRKIANEQAKTADQQRREQRFFDLLNLYQRTVDSLNFVQRNRTFLASGNKQMATTNIFQGKTAIEEWLSATGRDLLNYCENGFAEKENSSRCFVKNQVHLTELWRDPEVGNFVDQYFSIIYRILAEAEVLLGEDHYRYIKLFRAQLNRNELTLLAFNILLGEKGGKMTPYVEKYGLLKHLPEGYLRETLEESLPLSIFGRNRNIHTNSK